MNTHEVLRLLRAYESRNVTFVERDGSWPIVWRRARGQHVWDAEGRKYLDLTSAFGVAAAGHANPRVVKAGQRQMAELLHAMGDVHPHPLKAILACELSRLTFERWSNPKLEPQSPKLKSSPVPHPTSRISAKTIFCNSGFESVEAALKTALLATEKPGVIAFTGAYHGVGYGALNTTHRDHFRSPFRTQLSTFGHFVRFPTRDEDLQDVECSIQRLFRRRRIGAILVEPVQVRGGINIPPRKFLPLLRRLGDQHKALLILDEIYTGFGRTGRWFACEHSRIVPDLICLGKGLTGGFPLSACVGSAELMDTAWPESSGEAIHTSTFLGHPVGCAMALAQIAEIKARRLVQRSERLGQVLTRKLDMIESPSSVSLTSRGLGLMAGLELHRGKRPATMETLQVVKAMLHRGFILLPEGERANVLGFTPPLIISESDLTRSVSVLREVINQVR